MKLFWLFNITHISFETWQRWKDVDFSLVFLIHTEMVQYVQFLFYKIVGHSLEEAVYQTVIICS